MEYQFYRKEVYHNRKKYTVLIPKKHDQLWVVDWADDWYGGCFIDGSAECLFHLLAGYGAIAYNPYVILYLPVKNQKILKSLNNYDNGCYDMVFCTNRCQLKLSDWKAIRNKLKKSPFTTYKFDFDITRMNQYFKKDLDTCHLNDQVWLKKAGTKMQLYASTAFFVFPKAYYATNAISIYEAFYEAIERNDFASSYNSKSDDWTCKLVSSFVYGGVRKYQYTYEEPSITFYIELCDMEIMNRYKKEKEVLVENRNQAVAPALEGYHQLVIYPK